MSLSIIKDQLKERFSRVAGAFGSGRSIHEHGAQQLLYSYVTKEVEKDGKVESINEVNFDTIAGRTVIYAPGNMSTFFRYAQFYENFCGRGAQFEKLGMDYLKLMPSKNGESRKQFVMVATAAQLLEQNQEENTLKKVQET